MSDSAWQILHIEVFGGPALWWFDLARPLFFHSVQPVIMLLRFIGIMNAAVWIGAVVFYTFGAAPALSTDEARTVLGGAQAGIAGQLVTDRLLTLQLWCGIVALIHQVGEWFYLGRPLQRVTVGLVAMLFGLALVGAVLLQPRSRAAHEVAYGYKKQGHTYTRNDKYLPAQRLQASRVYATWGNITVSLNILTLAGLVAFTWRVLKPADTPRFLAANKFRS